MYTMKFFEEGLAISRSLQEAGRTAANLICNSNRIRREERSFLVKVPFLNNILVYDKIIQLPKQLSCSSQMQALSLD